MPYFNKLLIQVSHQIPEIVLDPKDYVLITFKKTKNFITKVTIKIYSSKAIRSLFFKNKIKLWKKN